MEIVRAGIFHTPTSAELVSHLDGGLAVDEGRIVDCGDYIAVRSRHREATVRDLRGGFLLPGLVDAHVHFPQVRVIGNLGLSLLEWLERAALPEESKMADAAYAESTAKKFVHSLIAHGTTTALVFGSHFAGATAALFDAAATSGLRVVSGLVASDRSLRPDLRRSPECVYKESSELIRRYHGHGRLQYAVTPRFALSASEAMLEVCQTLLREHESIRFQTHINESAGEIAEVARLFPWAADYLAVYERFGLSGSRSVMAHNVHASDSQLDRLASAGTSIAHCPASNAALGSGIFPLQRHLKAGVHVALGTDVGGGTGFGMLKEGLQAYLMQRASGGKVTAAQMLYLATRAGAQALGLAAEIGDFSIGKAADYVYLRAPVESPLADVLEGAEEPERIIAALFTLAGSESVAEVRVAGEVVRA